MTPLEEEVSMLVTLAAGIAGSLSSLTKEGRPRPELLDPIAEYSVELARRLIDQVKRTDPMQRWASFDASEIKPFKREQP